MDDSNWTPVASDDKLSAETHAATVRIHIVDPEFRTTVISRHDRTGPILGVDHPGLLDVAHALSWSEYREYRADLANIMVLSKTHHAAFNRGLSRIDRLQLMSRTSHRSSDPTPQTYFGPGSIFTHRDQQAS